MWQNISGRVFLAIFCERYLKNAILLYLSFSSHCMEYFVCMTWSAPVGCLYRHQTVPSYPHHHCGKWYTQCQPSLADPSKTSGACLSRKKGGRKGKVVFLKSKRAGLLGPVARRLHNCLGRHFLDLIKHQKEKWIPPVLEHNPLCQAHCPARVSVFWKDAEGFLWSRFCVCLHE